MRLLLISLTTTAVLTACGSEAGVDTAGPAPEPPLSTSAPAPGEREDATDGGPPSEDMPSYGEHCKGEWRQSEDRLPEGVKLTELHFCQQLSRTVQDGEWIVERTVRVTDGLDRIAEALTAPDQGPPAGPDTACTAVGHPRPTFVVRDAGGREWRPRLPYSSTACKVPSLEALNELGRAARGGEVVGEKKVRQLRTPEQVASHCGATVKDPIQGGMSEATKQRPVMTETLHVCHYRATPPSAPMTEPTGLATFVKGYDVPAAELRELLGSVETVVPSSGQCGGPGVGEHLAVSDSTGPIAWIEPSGCRRVAGHSWSLLGVTTAERTRPLVQ